MFRKQRSGGSQVAADALGIDLLGGRCDDLLGEADDKQKAVALKIA